MFMNMIVGMYQQYLFPVDENETPPLAYKTRKLYLDVVKRYLLEEPDLSNINSYVKYLINTGLKRRCYANKYAIFNFINWHFNKAEATRMINEIKQYTKSITVQTNKKYSNVKPLNDEEKSDVMNALEVERHRIIFLIEYITGFRTHDVLSIEDGGILKLKDEGVDCLKITTTDKGGKKQKVGWVYGPPVDIIWEWVKFKDDYETGFLFVRNRQPGEKYCRRPEYNTIEMLIEWNYRMFWTDVKQALTNCNIDRDRFAPHRLRHDFAIRVWKKYKDMNVLVNQMGHSNVNTSFRYLASEGLDKKDIAKEMQTG